MQPSAVYELQASSIVHEVLDRQEMLYRGHDLTAYLQLLKLEDASDVQHITLPNRRHCFKNQSRWGSYCGQSGAGECVFTALQC